MANSNNYYSVVCTLAARNAAKVTALNCVFPFNGAVAGEADGALHKAKELVGDLRALRHEAKIAQWAPMRDQPAYPLVGSPDDEHRIGHVRIGEPLRAA